ncbi:enoyl-CoA hydratase/isomerase family protein [Parafrankia sp. EUN1f]|uniref:enoyl-CoA hydratase/isomerase family protein n=1 Tax=Parafrankia sp. EUN1f TaxID=102897 RepID=UPI0001C442F9|nr:enoyl-CoA hydratase/isomerase family protein [Parafrankia sp. EUN1f]EFC84561.1 Enoyl-CoA hydratase/isomerase [Parafrankia sp. EUN1f]
MYDLPDEVHVEADGPLRIITLNRPDKLNAVNHELHLGLARVWTLLNEDLDARAVVLTGAGRAFSAGGDFAYLERLRRDPRLRRVTLMHGRDLVLGMARCRLPVVAAVNGPAAGLGCSLVALSDIVYMAEQAYLRDPHVQVGLVAADGGPLTWPLHTSLHWAKEYALTGAKIPAERALAMGLANHVVADPFADALHCAKTIASLPQQAVESTKRMLNIHLERAVLATLDYATNAEEQSFNTDDFVSILARLNAGRAATSKAGATPPGVDS